MQKKTQECSLKTFHMFQTMKSDGTTALLQLLQLFKTIGLSSIGLKLKMETVKLAVLLKTVCLLDLAFI